jgi:hypothetical protein
VKALIVGTLVAAVAASGSVAAQAGRTPLGPASAQKAALLVQVKVTLTDSKIVLSKKTAGRGLVIFKVTNVGAKKHDFKISGRTTKELSHGQSNSLRVTFVRKGAYTYQSTLPGDAAEGLKGVFTIG